jgi:hypothetical protein
MSLFNPCPVFDYYYKACRKGDREAKPVAVSYSPSGVLADAIEITGLPRDNFEVHEISKEEYEDRCRIRPEPLFPKPSLSCSFLEIGIFAEAAPRPADERNG